MKAIIQRGTQEDFFPLLQEQTLFQGDSALDIIISCTLKLVNIAQIFPHTPKKIAAYQCLKLGKTSNNECKIYPDVMRYEAAKKETSTVLN